MVPSISASEKFRTAIQATSMRLQSSPTAQLTQSFVRLLLHVNEQSKEVRAIPGAGFSAPWFKDPEGKQIPRSTWEQMSEK